MAGIYVHIPFCKSRCAYCDFFSTTRAGDAENYVRALSREVVRRRGEALSEGRACSAPVATIYFGGGTPSMLTPRQLDAILEAIGQNYTIAPDAEVTLEMNPDDVGRWPDVAALGVNRVSLGIQTFDDGLLTLIRRRHDARTAVEAVKSLQRQGIGNISIDLIYGLPGQTLELWRHDLDTAFALGIQHISAYALSFEPGTLLSRWRSEGRVSEAPDELSVEMFAMLCDRARQAGFQHYEISNFARPGCASRHNSSYWAGTPYLGFGPAAHSFDGLRTRRANVPDLDEYLRCWSSDDQQAIDEDARPQAATLEVLSDDELYEETVMCGLRTARGIDLSDIERRFGAERLRMLLATAERHIRTGRLRHSGNVLCINEKSLMVSDDIMSDFML